MPTKKKTLIMEGDNTSKLVVKFYDDGCLMLIQGRDYVHLTVEQLRAITTMAGEA